MPVHRAIGLFVASFAIVPGVLRIPGPPSGAAGALLARTSVAHYRHWSRVNPEPALFHAAPAAQCDAPHPSQLPSVHRDKYITVYVNPIGREAMLTQKTPVFPVGSVIVKEKRPARDADTVELLTVMVKREKGFNPESGDWEYAVLDGKATHVQAEGKLETCQSCHSGQKSRDYVFRDPYLPEAVRNGLK